MKTEDFEKSGVPHDIAEKCATASAEELTGYIPKHRFDEMILARDTERRQREEIEKKISDLEKGRASADELKAELDPAKQSALRQEKKDEYDALFCNPYEAASYGYIDDVIEPRNTRFRVCRALEQLAGKKQDRPAKKHDNLPL